MMRVAVTGLGVISSIGHNQAEFWRSLSNGEPGIRPLQSVDRTRFRFANGAEVVNYDPANYFDPKTADLLDRFAQFGTIAAREAVTSAGISWTPELKARTAIITGCCVGGQATEDVGFVDLYTLNKDRVHPLTIPRIMGNAAASQISREFGITGPVFTISTACASANHAIGNALWLLRAGAADMVVAGGSEAIFSFGFLKAWEAMRVVSPDTCRPFSAQRKGLILGEGGAMLVLEPLDAARARGATILAELAGFGMSADAHHITQPTVDGPVAAMRSALADARLAPEQIGYINAHGTGTAANDSTETKAIRSLFGPLADHLPVSSTKSMHGHALGSAGALESVATILAMRNGLLPPTANYLAPDPECDLDIVPNTARPKQFEAALSNAFAFGGLNAVLAFRSSS